MIALHPLFVLLLQKMYFRLQTLWQVNILSVWEGWLLGSAPGSLDANPKCVKPSPWRGVSCLESFARFLVFAASSQAGIQKCKGPWKWLIKNKNQTLRQVQLCSSSEAVGLQKSHTYLKICSCEGANLFLKLDLTPGSVFVRVKSIPRRKLPVSLSISGLHSFMWLECLVQLGQWKWMGFTCVSG